MKRIGIYLERKPESGGAYQYCLAMLKALSKLPGDSFEVTAFCTYDEWKTITEPISIKTVIVQKNRIQKILHYIAEKTVSVAFYRRHCQWLHPLTQKFHENCIDCCIYPCGDKISFMLKTPAVVSVFDLMHRYLVEFPEISAPDIFKSRERSYTNIAKYAKLILVDSEVGREQMIECYGSQSGLAEKIAVLPFIAPGYVYDSAGKEKYLCPNLKFTKYIFYPAQFWKHKNHKNLLLAMAKLKDKGICINAVFCGSGKNAYDEVRQLIQENELEKQVQILGYVSNQEMVALYQHARALIMPTFGGPTNIPQLEAFALGCPVATSGIFGIPQQVGDAALLFKPDSVDEIADCIQKLWENDELCKQLIEKGKINSGKWGEKQFAVSIKNILNNVEYFSET